MMPKAKLEKDRDYICCELLTGQKIGGVLRITDRRIAVRLVCFDERSELEGGNLPLISSDPNYLPLRLEDGLWASLFGAFVQSLIRPLRWVRDRRVQGLLANTLVHGSSKWEPGDPVRRVSFELPHADEFLRHSLKVRELETSNRVSLDDRTIFTIQLPGQKVTLSYRGSRARPDRPVRIDAAVITVEFETPRTIATYLEDVWPIVRFVVAIVSFVMVPENIRIQKASLEEMHGQNTRKVDQSAYAITEMWVGVPSADKADVHFSETFASLHTKEEADAFRDCLDAWLRRAPKWRRAGAQMVECLRLRHEISAERLLAACKWFEEIPTASAVRTIPKGVLKPVVEAAVGAAKGLDIPEADSRIRGSLAKLGDETREEQFRRLLKGIAACYGADIADEEMLDHLKAAKGKFRGRCAHGAYQPGGEDDADQFMKAIYALEALCFLLTCIDLPMTENGMQRIKQHPLVAQYHSMQLD